jgi:hypothetical protein
MGSGLCCGLRGCNEAALALAVLAAVAFARAVRLM